MCSDDVQFGSNTNEGVIGSSVMARALEKVQLIFGTPAADRGIAGRTSRLIRLAPTCDRDRRDCPPRRIDSPGRRREMSCHHRVRDAIGGWTLSVNGLGGLALADIGLGMLSLGLAGAIGDGQCSSCLRAQEDGT